MPVNRAAYDEAMSNGHNAAWDHDWQIAINAYGQAIQHMPEDAEAHIFLGSVLLEVGRLDDALKVYSRAYQLSPKDPIPLEKSADILEKIGRSQDAAQQYINVADLYLAQRDLDKAIYNWDRATRLTSGLVAIHAKLAQAFERIGDKPRSIREFLILAHTFQQLGERERAVKAIQRALQLDSKFPASLNALRAIETGVEMVPPTKDEAKSTTKAGSGALKPSARTLMDSNIRVSDLNPLGPLGEAMNDALNMLATYVVESGRMDSATADAMQGMELQRQNAIEPAVEAYLRAERSFNHPALKMNLGCLLLQANRYDEAIHHLGEATLQPQLTSGAQHALGKAFVGLNRQKMAMRYFIQSLQGVDAAVSGEIGDNSSQASLLYDHLLTILDNRSDDVLSAANTRFMGLLSGKEWKTRIVEMRRQIQETASEQGDQGVVDMLVASHSDEVAEAVGRVDRYMRQGLFTLAMDEAQRTVEFSPFYLPIHVRMAEIMMKEGRVRPAVDKYNIIARTYMVRGEDDRAAAILSEALEMSPLDITIRESLIHLLEKEERWDEVVDQYADLADTHSQLGDLERSRDIFIKAEKLAHKAALSPDKIVRIKHRVADIDQLRMDIRRAQRAYEEIIQLSSSDKRAHRALIDIHYRQGNTIDAIKKLDALLGIFARERQINQITQLLEELVTLYQRDTGLRSRLAAIYRQLNRRADAIQQLDTLGELQLEAGQHHEAVGTIRQIIALNPPGIDEYKRLLSQLGG